MLEEKCLKSGCGAASAFSSALLSSVVSFSVFNMWSKKQSATKAILRKVSVHHPFRLVCFLQCHN